MPLEHCLLKAHPACPYPKIQSSQIGRGSKVGITACNDMALSFSGLQCLRLYHKSAAPPTCSVSCG